MKALYTAHATATRGGRANGHTRTDDGKIDVNLSTPKEMGGDGGPGTNPEQLFAAGYAACFLGAVKLAASKSGHKIAEESTVTAAISFADREDNEGFAILAKLEVHLPGIDKATADDIVARAHRICPYSHVGRSGFPVETTVV
jgi:Ohr subfamily peroxiredoxin